MLPANVSLLLANLILLLAKYTRITVFDFYRKGLPIVNLIADSVYNVLQ